ncbi:MAG: tyrosine-type recombinase/integrase [Methanomicrobia archaeon]|nr:tyrosine-type recombinase/integrase [Methanomicrobia archaeon]
MAAGEPRIFGKFELHEAPKLRDWELYFGIEDRDGADAWKSKYPSIQKWLRHLRRYTKSTSTMSVYLRILHRFCQYTSYGPDELVKLPPEKVEELIMDFVDELGETKYSRAYLNSIIRRLLSFFRVNGYETLKVRTYFVPARYRKKKEYIPTKDEMYRIADGAGSARNRALLLSLFSSGLRISTLCALNYEDVRDDVENGKEIIKIPVYPEMKERVPDACKGNIPYCTFICAEAAQVLKAFLRERKEKFVNIAPDEPLFCSDWTLWKKAERMLHRPAPQTVNKIIKTAARRAGIEQWEHISAHCLRKAFESVLREPTVDGGRMDPSTQQFLFGHILPGSQDAYYDKDKVEYHRAEYAKLNFARSPMETKLTDILLASVRAASAGISDDPEKIIGQYIKAKYGEGKEILWRLLPQEEQVTLIKDAMEWKRGQLVPEVKTAEKVISVEKLESYLSRDWSFVAKIDDYRCVVRRRPA